MHNWLRTGIHDYEGLARQSQFHEFHELKLMKDYMGITWGLYVILRYAQSEE